MEKTYGFLGSAHVFTKFLLEVRYFGFLVFSVTKAPFVTWQCVAFFFRSRNFRKKITKIRSFFIFRQIFYPEGFLPRIFSFDFFVTLRLFEVVSRHEVPPEWEFTTNHCRDSVTFKIEL